MTEKAYPPSFTSSIASKAATLWEGTAPLLKFRAFSDFDPFIDSRLFPTDLEISTTSVTQLKVMEEGLVDYFMETMNTPHTSSQDETSLWKMYRKKAGVEYFKRIISYNDKMIEMVKGKISIQCDFSRVFSVCLFF